LDRSKRFGRRSGYTEIMEVQQVTEKDTEMATGNYKSHPNSFCEISEEYVQGTYYFVI
jgi:hypothetical protein